MVTILGYICQHLKEGEILPKAVVFSGLVPPDFVVNHVPQVYWKLLSCFFSAHYVQSLASFIYIVIVYIDA